MSDGWGLLFALLVGLGLGAFFFGGLWWTVQRGMRSTRPALLFLSSMLLRTLVVVVGFYLIAGDDYQRLIAALLGFIVARLIATRLSRRKEVEKVAQVSHALKS